MKLFSFIIAASLIIVGCSSRNEEIPQDALERVIEDYHSNYADTLSKIPVQIRVKYSNENYYIVYITKAVNSYLLTSPFIPYKVYEKDSILYCVVDLERKPNRDVLNILEEHHLLEYPTEERDGDKIFSDTTEGMRLDHYVLTYYYFVCRSDLKIIEKRENIDLMADEDLPVDICN